MWPIFDRIYKTGSPFSRGQIGLEEAYRRTEQPLVCSCTARCRIDHQQNTALMVVSNLPMPCTLAVVPTNILISAFILHEMTVAFKIGILLFIPFLIITWCWPPPHSLA
jgi:flagellar biosynthetic protein FliP